MPGLRGCVEVKKWRQMAGSNESEKLIDTSFICVLPGTVAGCRCDAFTLSLSSPPSHQGQNTGLSSPGHRLLMCWRVQPSSASAAGTPILFSFFFLVSDLK